MEPVGGEILSCRLVSAQPMVVAEVIFSEKAGAEDVIATFDNQRVSVKLFLYKHDLEPERG